MHTRAQSRCHLAVGMLQPVASGADLCAQAVSSLPCGVFRESVRARGGRPWMHEGARVGKVSCLSEELKVP